MGLEFCCPCCKAAIEIQVSEASYNPATERVSDLVQEVDGRFPPSWTVYGGQLFSDVWKIDREYMIRLSDDKRLHGRLRETLLTFLNSKEE